MIWKKFETLCTANGNIKWWHHWRKEFGGFSESKCWITVWSSHFTPRYISRRTASKDSGRYLHTKVHTSTIHNIQMEQHKCPSVDGWINKMWHIHVKEYYSGLKRNEIPIDAATCINLEDMMI